jgi:hypothetical protein
MMVPVVPMLETKCVILPWVGELVEHGALLLAHHLLREVARRLHAAGLRREDQLGAERAHGLAPLGREVLGHDQHQAVAADRRRHGERDAGVARSGLDQGVAGLDRAARLGVADHGNGGPVLDRAGGVVALQLREDDVLVAARQALQPHQRRVADEVLDGLVHDFCSTATYSATPCSTVLNSRW